MGRGLLMILSLGSPLQKRGTSTNYQDAGYRVTVTGLGFRV